MITTGDTDRLDFIHGALKIREFTNKSTSEKEKLLAKDLGTSVEDLFPNYLDEVRAMSPDQTKKRSVVPVIPIVNMKRKPEGKLYDSTAQKIQKAVKESVTEKRREDERNKKSIPAGAVVGQNQVWTSLGVVNLVKKSPG